MFYPYSGFKLDADLVEPSGSIVRMPLETVSPKGWEILAGRTGGNPRVEYATAVVNDTPVYDTAIAPAIPVGGSIMPILLLLGGAWFLTKKK